MTTIQNPPNSYLPGQGVRFSCPAYQGGQLEDPDLGMTLTITWPDGTTATPSVQRDGQGLYHADVAVPDPMVPKIGFYIWRANTSNPNEAGRAKQPFRVISETTPF